MGLATCAITRRSFRTILAVLLLTLVPAADAEETSNSEPRIFGSPRGRVEPGRYYFFRPQAFDPDGDQLTFTISNKPEWATFLDRWGILVGRPGPEDDGVYSDIVISVTDQIDVASLAPFDIEVVSTSNGPPRISGDPPGEVLIGEQYSFTPDASDPDGDPLTFSIAGQPGWTRFDPSTGKLTGTPAAGDEGTYGSIVISVSDGESSASLAPFAVTVARPELGTAELTWTPPLENTDGSPLLDLAGYSVYWGTASGEYSETVTIDNPGLTAYVVENLEPGTWFFVVTAVNAAGVESDFSNEVSKAIP